MKWVENYIEITPPSKLKKITGTRLASILGCDPFNTPFKTWCDITKTYVEPFEGNKYTNAGQIIEPKVFDFLKYSMGFGNSLKTPTDVYGENYFNKTWGDFFRDRPIFGGMWDALIVDEYGNPKVVVEIKTVQVDGKSGALEDRWKNGEAPNYQALQASLYAYLLGIDNVMMVAVALKDSKGDYEHPENVVPSYANENVYIDYFAVSERYPQFPQYIKQVATWWHKHVETGVSPKYDEKKDAEILKVLRTNTLNPTTDIDALVKEAESLQNEINAVSETITDKEKRLKQVKDQIKEYAIGQFRDGDKKVEIKGSQFNFTISKTTSEKFDDKQFKVDNPDLYQNYIKTTETYKLTNSLIKEDK